MNEDRLAERFEAQRARLRAVAYRMLGSAAEADDAVQEAWLRLSRSAAAEIENLDGWLTTVVARVCLNLLQSRKSRREDPMETRSPEVSALAERTDPEQEALLADSVGLALLVVLDTLTPAERLTFVLHDMFAVPFDQIADIVDRSPAAARQLASRARRRVRGASPGTGGDAARRHAVVEAFLAASRGGEFAALLALLDPAVVVRSDEAAVLVGAPAEARGAQAAAEIFAGRARAARPALLDGAPGLVWMQGGLVRMAFGFTIDGDRVTAIDIVADREEIDRLNPELPRDEAGSRPPTALMPAATAGGAAGRDRRSW